jgi:cytochrome c peroxidase
MSEEKVELGRLLFYDVRLSANGGASCATCHAQEHAFASAQATAVGATGEDTPRSPMSLANVAYAKNLTWANPLLVRLETQALVPLFGEEPLELGAGDIDALLERLAEVPRYQDAFARAFPGEADRVTLVTVTDALACFERSLISAGSPYDAHLGEGEDSLSASALRGWEVFESLECGGCHAGFTLSDGLYHNVGLPNGAYLAPDRGVAEVSGREEDVGLFKTPTLRNVGLTAPYMHDGSLATLEDVIDHLSPRPVTNGERTDLVAFLHSLTDEPFVTDRRFGDPWIEP